ncbi:ankyrin repeat-containing protein [Anaeramoeba flamelloides]|uniref:Ankyrin repeat-containing protein n=1 Tax=Anaeramoeba flamelloides TaxID=1746091 RepID=A0AAV8A374_9EUKA|nr:ankyrin repeat-containing protein [Anaeramoeba flamelloides]
MGRTTPVELAKKNNQKLERNVLKLFGICSDENVSIKELNQIFQKKRSKRKSCISTKVDVNATKYEIGHKFGIVTGYTPLMTLCSNPNVTCELILFLIQEGANPNADAKGKYNSICINALSEMCSNPKVTVQHLQTLFESGALLTESKTKRKEKNKKTNKKTKTKITRKKQINKYKTASRFAPLMALCGNPNVSTELIDELIEKGADPNFGSDQTHLPNSFQILSSNKNTTVELLQFFIKKGFAIEKMHVSLGSIVSQILPCSDIKISIIKYLVEKGASLNERNIDGNNAFLKFLQLSKFGSEYEPLSTHKLSFLSNEISNINEKNEFGENALMMLCKNRTANLKSLKMLLKMKGIDLNMIDVEGNTALCYLIMNYMNKIKQNDLPKMLFQLIKYGADPQIRNNKDENALQVLKSCQCECDKKTMELITNILNIDPHCLENDFKRILNSGEFSDCKIKDIPVHKLIIEMRTGKKIEQIKDILENPKKKISKEDILLFLNWVYFDNVFEKIETSVSKQKQKYEKLHEQLMSKTQLQQTQLIKPQILRVNDEIQTYSEQTNQFNFNQNDDDDDDDALQLIFTKLKLKEAFTSKKLKQCLQDLYLNHSTKDFKIIFNENQSIKIHKLILQIRSGLFRGMFLTIKDPNISQIKNYSKYSLETLQILFKFLYLNDINYSDDFVDYDKNETKQNPLNENIIQQIVNTIDFYQLNPNCDLKFQVLFYNESINQLKN